MIAKKYFLLFLFVFFCQSSFCQLSNFTLNVTHTNETCPANGTLNFTTSNTTTGSIIIFSIYRLPNLTTPISVTSLLSFDGLISGNYRVIATQSLGSNSGTQQQDETITNQIVSLTYQLVGTDEICGNDGKITVNTISGNAVFYEIFAGPIIRPLQSSNVFNGLVAGQYQIRVFDACGEGVVQTFSLFYINPQLNFTLNSPSLLNCTIASIGFSFETVFQTGIVKYPLLVQTTVNYNGGTTQTYSQTITSGLSYIISIPFSTNQPYNYSFQITDGCGAVYNLNGVIQNLTTNVNYTLVTQDCSHKLVIFNNISSLVLINAPASFPVTVPNNYTAQIVNNIINISGLTAGTYVFNAVNICGVSQTITFTFQNETAITPYYVFFNKTCTSSTVVIYNIQSVILTNAPSTYPVVLPQNYTSLINASGFATFLNLPIGTYSFLIIDTCGVEQVFTITVVPFTQNPTFQVLQSCQESFGSVKMNGQFASVNIISAPTSYTQSLPYNVSSAISLNNTVFTIDILPAGNYTFQSVDACGNVSNTSITISGYQENTEITVLPNCGSFDLNLVHTSNNSTLNSFWLQKYNPITGNWFNPLSGNIFTGNIPNSGNSYPLINNAINYNLAFTGVFRILKSQSVFLNGVSSAGLCYGVIEEFEFSGQPKINQVYAISCNGNFEVVVDAVGIPTLQYRITTKDGQPFSIENGTSSTFSNLEAATYNFQVEDGCGTILNNVFQIINPNPLQITPSTFCNGQQATLTTPYFSFLQYQWWKDSDATTILSTTNSLVFSSFNNALDSGTYHVQISYLGNPSSCLNQILDYTISSASSNPNAGQDVTLSYCGNQGIINLNTLLQGSYDAIGSWTEATSSGTLVNNLWDSTSVNSGNFQFIYRVEGLCDLFDESIINITVNEIPVTPLISSDAIICQNQDLNLYATSTQNVTYSWIGPNNFISSEQNPIITNATGLNNGTYSLTISNGNCGSESISLEVVVNPILNFELTSNCIENNLIVEAYSTENNSNFINSTFNWSGPNSFSSSENPINISGLEMGVYWLTVTNEFDCQLTKSINIERTICQIPNVITPNNDGSNDYLDLSGFDVNEIQVFNRWGKLVYNKENYKKEWYGQNNNGGKLPNGTYFYFIKLATEEKKGWIFVTN